MRNAVRLALVLIVAAAGTGCAWRMGHIEKGFRAFNDEDYAKAEREFYEALKDDPDNPYAQLNLGATFQNTGRLGLAIPLYQRVLITGKDVRPTRKANAEDTKTADGKEVDNPTLAELAMRNLNQIAAQAQAPPPQR